MALFTEDHFNRIAQGESGEFETARNLALQESRSYPDHQFDIFLSHSYRDKSVIKGLFIELSRLGYKVYVDWIIDHEVDRNLVTSQTADLLQLRMRQSAGLIYATSVHSQASKWMQWEIGFMDGYSHRKCAILPIATEEQENYKGFEFLGLYPYIGVDEKSSGEFLLYKNHQPWKPLKTWI